MYPGALVLYIRRHPVAAVCSRRERFPFNKETPLAELARTWKNMEQKVAQCIREFPGKIHTLRYEDLLDSQENELGKIAVFLGFDFNFSKTSYFSSEMRKAALAHETWKFDDSKRPLINSNDRYRDKITPEQARRIEAIMAEEMNRAGYKPYFQT